ncbi:Phosphoribosylformylglycinamidine cyclo-ligase [Eubacterium plexicaudatum ASF492]|uniref:Phosphoribosylformylglycinamidine cyclo-ligase n=1 Tax=Eubacterium plexicaudatum ASF492 TaxID=1235802 RepID=N2B2S6_9FIRM|nr:Phosphoribosylformylglycinamidine cyclo-ligase [Eubacterium plexicaudatum ASF492]
MREKFGLRKLENEILLDRFRTMSQPTLVSGTNGLSGKLYIASEMDKMDKIGYDCVAACVNDMAALGAEPLFFYMNISCVRPRAEKIRIIEDGITLGCEEAHIQFAGCEIVELPDKYAFDQYELAGFIVGILDGKKKIGSARLASGDVIIGLPSNGLHNNGYVLARKQLFLSKGTMEVYYDTLGATLGEQLLKPTKMYYTCMKHLLEAGTEVKSCVQVAHGGLDRALRLLLHERYGAVVKQRTDTIPPIYQMLHKDGNIDIQLMRQTFNMGIGMLMIVAEDVADKAAEYLEEAGERPVFLGLVETERDLIRYLE